MAVKRMTILLSILLVAGSIQAQSVPDLVNYQGRLTGATGAALTTDDYALRFEVYDDPVDTSPAARVWGPLCFDVEAGGTPSTGHKYQVPVVQGYFNVVLDQDTGSGDCDTAPGLGTPITAAFAGAPRYMEVAVKNDDVWEPILPRQPVMTAPFAAHAVRAHEVVCDASSTRLSVTNETPAEVDVLTVGVAGTEMTGTASLNGSLNASGDASVAGDASVGGDLTVGGSMVREVVKHAPGSCPIFWARDGACCQSPYLNTWDGILNASCPGNWVLQGLVSIHDNDYEDRLWGFKCCPLQTQ